MGGSAAVSLLRKALQLNILVGLSSASIAVAAVVLVGSTPTWAGGFVAFVLTFAVYNFDRIADDTASEGQSTPERSATVQRTRPWMRLLIPALLLSALGLAGASGLRTLAWTLSFPALGFAYVLPLIPGKLRRPKDVPYFKGFYVAACWVLFVPIGLAFSGADLTPQVAAFAAFVFLRTFVSTYLGDLRDLREDADAGIATLAGALGTTGSYRLLDGLHIASALLLVASIVGGALPTTSAILLLPASFGFGLYRYYRKHPDRHELTFELYDLEVVAYAPCLMFAF